DVLYRQAWIRLIEPDGSTVCPRGKVDELLEVLSARRRWRAFGELEQEIEDLSDILREVGDVFVEVAVVDRKEADLVVLKRHELSKMGSADGVEVCRYSMAPGAKKQLRFIESDARFGRQDDQKWIQYPSAIDPCGRGQSLNLLRR